MAGESGDAVLGAAIRAAREKRDGWKQPRLAKAVGVSQQTVSNWETGKRGLTPRELADVAVALDTSTDELLGLGVPANSESGFLRVMRRLDGVLDDRGKNAVEALAEHEAKEAQAANQEALVQRLVAAGFGEPEAIRAAQAVLGTAPSSPPRGAARANPQRRQQRQEPA